MRERVEEFQRAGISGVDLYLACFGPALEEFFESVATRPAVLRVRRRLRASPEPSSRALEEDVDPYAATPEDALDAARREVKRWRLEQLTHVGADTDLDPATRVLRTRLGTRSGRRRSPTTKRCNLAAPSAWTWNGTSWDGLAEKKSSDLLLWDSSRRAAKGALGQPDGSRGMIDAIHHAANRARGRSLADAREMLSTAQIDSEPHFFTALEAVLEVLPVPEAFSGVDLEGAAAGRRQRLRGAVPSGATRLPRPDRRAAATGAVAGRRRLHLNRCLPTAPGSGSTRPDDGDLVTLFYVPALQDAVRYDRLTGYFNAGARWRWPRAASRNWCGTAATCA